MVYSLKDQYRLIWNVSHNSAQDGGCYETHIFVVLASWTKLGGDNFDILSMFAKGVFGRVHKIEMLNNETIHLLLPIVIE